MKKLFKFILALGLSSVLWAFVNSSLSIVALQDTAVIEYKSLDNNLILLNAPKEIAYQIEANPHYPKNIKANLKMSVDLSNKEAGWHTIPINYSNGTYLPAYAKIKLASRTVRVFIDEKYFKNLEIQPYFNYYNKKNDFIISNISVSPKSVLLEGPRSIIEKIDHIKTKAIFINSPGSFSIKEKLDLSEPETSIPIEFVLIKYTAQQNIQKRKMELPIYINDKNMLKSLKVESISQESINLLIQGLPSQLDLIENNPQSLFVDLNGISKPGIYKKISVLLNIPNNTTSLSNKSILVVDVVIKESNNEKEFSQETEEPNVAEEAPSIIVSPPINVTPPPVNTPSIIAPPIEESIDTEENLNKEERGQ